MVIYALRVIDKVRRSLSILRNKLIDLYAALLLLKLTKSLDIGVYEDTVSGGPEPAPIAPPSCRPRPPARLRHPLALSGLVPLSAPPFGFSATSGRFYRPQPAPPSIKHRSSSSQLCRRTFSSFSCPTPFLSAPTNFYPLACHLMHRPFHFRRRCCSIHR